MRNRQRIALCMAAMLATGVGSGMTAMAGVNAFSIDMTDTDDNAWADIAMANDDTVDTGINIRSKAGEEGDVVGFLYRGGAVRVVSRGEEWSEVRSGNVSGYIRNDLLTFGDDAKGLAEHYGQYGVKASWNDVKIFASDDACAKIIGNADDGDTYPIVNHNGHWVEVQNEKGATGFVSSEDVDVVIMVDSAVPAGEESAAQSGSADAKTAEAPAAAAEVSASEADIAYEEAAPAAETEAAAGTEEVYADAAYTDAAYTDTAYTDAGYTDAAYTDAAAYTDTAYTDAAYTDATYTDAAAYTDTAYTDAAYTDAAYTDATAYADTAYTDTTVYTDDSYTAADAQTYTDDTYTDAMTAGEDAGYADGSYGQTVPQTTADAVTDTTVYADEPYDDEAPGSGVIYYEDAGNGAEETAVQTASDLTATQADAAADAQTAAEASTQGSSSAYTDEEAELLAALIYCEAGNQPYEGQVAVGSVVMNRLESDSFPDTISDVINQSGQFTPAYSGALDSALASGAGDGYLEAAQAALSGEDPTNGSLYFNTSHGSGQQIGDHWFY